MEPSASRERRKLAQRLLAEIVGLSREERGIRLGEIGREDPRLREEVETLLDQPSAEETEHPLEAPPAEMIAGRYRLISELGRGAMGVVHKALDTRLDRPVALKFLSPHLGGDAKARARLTAEAKAVSALDHPHICTLYEIAETDDGRLFLVMAYYEGETLDRLIERGPLPFGDAVRLATHLARGLGAAHRRGIVHRDIKPSNIFVTEEGAAKILDFGIAKVAGSAMTRTGDTLGTIEYMSPDQLRGEVDARTDVWALGVVLYEMLTGARPFRGDYEAALLYVILHEEPPPLAQHREEVPEALAQVVRRCMEKDIEARYQSAEEVEADLERLQQPEPPQPAPPVPEEPAPPGKPLRLRPPRWALAVLGVVVLAMALAIPQVRSALPGREDTSHGEAQETPALRQLAVVPLSVEGEDAAVGEGLTIALTHLLAQLGPHAEKPFTVVAVREMREITSAEEAREHLGTDRVILGELAVAQADGSSRGPIRMGLEYSDLQDTRRWNLTLPGERLAMLHLQTVDTWVEHFGIALPVETFATLSAGGTANADAYTTHLRGLAALHHPDPSGGVDDAIAFFQRALQEDARFALAHAGLGEAYRQKYKASGEARWVELTEQHCARALELASGLAPAHATLGALYSSTGDRAAAIREYERAAELSSSDADVYSSLGRLYTHIGQREQAETHFRQAIVLEPRTWEHYKGLSEAYAAWNLHHDAIEVIEAFMTVVPEDPEGVKRLARAYEELAFHTEDEQQRIAALERAAEVRPTHDAYVHLAHEYARAGRHAEEVQALERALERTPDRHESWGRIAMAHERAGSPADSVRSAYERAMERAAEDLDASPQNPRILLAMTDYALGLDRAREARRFLSEAVEADEARTLVAEAASLYERMGMRAEALELVRQALASGRLPADFEDDGGLADLRADPRYRQLKPTASE